MTRKIIMFTYIHGNFLATTLKMVLKAFLIFNAECNANQIFTSQECELLFTVTKNSTIFGPNQQYFEFPEIGNFPDREIDPETKSGIPGPGNPDIGIAPTTDNTTL